MHETNIGNTAGCYAVFIQATYPSFGFNCQMQYYGEESYSGDWGSPGEYIHI